MMKILSVTYNLHEDGQTRSNLLAALQRLDNSIQALPTQWFIKTKMNPAVLFRHLKPFLRERDQMIVTRVRRGTWSSQGLDAAVRDRLREFMLTTWVA